jgi:drug/metabolite transporter (DMT)-like permease
VALGIGCTAVAYVLFFRLIERIGASRAVTVTFLVPVFGTLWGALFLGESVTLPMLLGGAVVLVGTGLSTGVIRWPWRG